MWITVVGEDEFKPRSIHANQIINRFEICVIHGKQIGGRIEESKHICFLGN